MLFDIPKDVGFPEIFGFKQYFWFSDSKLGPKMNQNCKLGSIWIKIQTFEGISNHCVCLTGWLPLVKTYHRYVF